MIQQLGFWILKNQVNVDYYFYFRRRAECTSFGPGLKHLSLSSRVYTYRGETCRGASHGIYSTKHPCPSRRAATLCVFSFDTYVATNDARLVLCSSCSLGPSPRRPTASCSLAAERRGDCVRASRLYWYSNASIATRTLVCTFRIAAVCTAVVLPWGI